jgi:hypothetical protein
MPAAPAAFAVFTPAAARGVRLAFRVHPVHQVHDVHVTDDRPKRAMVLERVRRPGAASIATRGSATRNAMGRQYPVASRRQRSTVCADTAATGDPPRCSRAQPRRNDAVVEPRKIRCESAGFDATSCCPDPSVRADTRSQGDHSLSEPTPPRDDPQGLSERLHASLRSTPGRRDRDTPRFRIPLS